MAQSFMLILVRLRRIMSSGRLTLVAGMGLVCLGFLAAGCNRQSSAAGNSPPSEFDKVLAKRSKKWTNSLGMIFSVTKSNVWFCIWETRVRDYQVFAEANKRFDNTAEMWVLRNTGWACLPGFNWRNPGFQQTENHPVVGVSWDDAKAFCEWLTLKERREGLIHSNQTYRLPKDIEWSLANGFGMYPWGDQWPPGKTAGNFAGREARDQDWPETNQVMEGWVDAFPRTAPVGSYQANWYGLYDLAGNVNEWCEDWYNKDLNWTSLRNKYPHLNNDFGGFQMRVVRGGSWCSIARESLYTLCRDAGTPDLRYSHTGFRCVLEVSELND